jgi:hypothetical protein
MGKPLVKFSTPSRAEVGTSGVSEHKAVILENRVLPFDAKPFSSLGGKGKAKEIARDIPLSEDVVSADDTQTFRESHVLERGRQRRRVKASSCAVRGDTTLDLR